MIWLIVTPEREEKTLRIMQALNNSIPESRIVYGAPPDDGNPFVVWGQIWTALQVIPDALKTGRPFWYIDNGYWRSAKGGRVGYYRITYNGMTPFPLDMKADRNPVDFRPWRKDGGHIVLAMPGANFGRAIGLNMPAWEQSIQHRVREYTDRPFIVRRKERNKPLDRDLHGAWALVTHSSTVAVDAVRMGVPVFVEPTSAARWVGCTDLADIESPVMPSRQAWWRSLMWQQFTLAEMQGPLAWQMMRRQRAFAEKSIDGDL